MKKIIVLLFFVLLLSGCSPKGEVSLEYGTDTVEVFGSFELAGCLVNIDGVDHQMNVVSNTVDVDVLGQYIVEYEYEDGSRDYECQRVVFVVDQTKPTMNLLAGKDTIFVGETWIDGGVEAFDNYDQVVTVSVVENTVDETVAGSYQVTYQAEDSSGNVKEVIRNVHVLESE